MAQNGSVRTVIQPIRVVGAAGFPSSKHVNLDVRLSTLRRYAEAVGANLQISLAQG
jgi:hypothetical protein